MPDAKTPRRLFTVEQANAMLPLVHAIVGDIITLANGLRQRHERLQRNPPGAALSAAHQEELEQANRDMELDLERLHDLQGELAELGIELKDYFQGLVDFPARFEDRIVYLCWKAGETAVTHWHELDAGFAGRRALPPSPPGPLSHKGQRGRQADISAPKAEGTTVPDRTP